MVRRGRGERAQREGRRTRLGLGIERRYERKGSGVESAALLSSTKPEREPTDKRGDSQLATINALAIV